MSFSYLPSVSCTTSTNASRYNLNAEESHSARSNSMQTSNLFDTSFNNNQTPLNDYFDYSNSILELFRMQFLNNQPSMPSSYFPNTSYNRKSFNTNKDNLPKLNEVYNRELSERLATIAEATALEMNTTGRCGTGVNTSLRKAGLIEGILPIDSAYQEADILANHPNFQEVKVSNLKELLPGTIIVWNANTSGKPDVDKADTDGHIAIIGFNEREASDKLREKLLKFEEYRVFAPVQNREISTQKQKLNANA